MTRIKRPLLFLLGAGFILLLAVSLVSSHLSLKHYREGDFRARINTADRLFSRELDQERHRLATLAMYCLHDASLRSAFLAKDRPALQKAALPFFQGTGKNGALADLTFINPDRSVFLRLDQPARFGDTLPALSPTPTNGRGATIIETGVSGRLTVKGLYPWIIDGQQVGSIQLVKEIPSLLPQLKEILGMDLALLPADQAVPTSTAGPPSTTLAQIPAGLAAKIQRQDRHDRKQLFTTSWNGRQYLTGFFPVQDAHGRRLGNVALLKDVSARNRSHRRLYLAEGAVALIIGGLLFLLFRSFLGRTETSLSEANQVLEDIGQGITESILLLSKDFKILWANHHALEETGHELTEIIGQYCYKITHHLNEPCQPPHDICPLHELLDTGRPTRVEHIHFDKDNNKLVVAVTAYPIRDANGEITKFVHVSKDISERKQAEEERERLVAKLQEALREVKALSGMLPICSSCKKIRDDQGYWNQIESYIRAHSEAEFSHSICPECFKKLYPEYCDDKPDQ